MLSVFAEIVTPPPSRTPDKWADDVRVLPKGSAEPGKMRMHRTPYVVPIGRAFMRPEARRIGFLMARQMAKTNGVAFNVIGWRLDDDPTPIVYIGPTQSNIDDVIEPKVQEMLENAPSLDRKRAKGQGSKKHAKLVSGVNLRLGWAGSSTQLKADSAGIAFVDELDGIEAEHKGGGEGSVVDMAEAITSTYPEGKVGLTSTPTYGNVESKEHPDTGLLHWSESDSVQSAIWKIWQEGTRHEWGIPCPHCKDYFIPRFQLLTWPDGANDEEAEQNSWLACSNCGAGIEDKWRQWMNDRGVMIAPGQKPIAYADEYGSFSAGGPGLRIQDFTKDGNPIQNVEWGDYLMPRGRQSQPTFWVSGLCTFSAKKSYGFIAAKWLQAVASGDPERIQGVINTDAGELFRVGGDAPLWTEVQSRCAPYKLGDVPEDVELVTIGIDVQKRYLVWVARGWAAGYQSWLIDRGELWGETDQLEVWSQAEQLLNREFAGIPVHRMGIDSGYRSDSVYEFCRGHMGHAVPTRGHDQLSKPYHAAQIDVTLRGKFIKNGIQIWHFDTDVAKSWVHGRVQRAADQDGAWHLPEDIDEDYCKQIVAESRVVKPSGKPVWVKTGANHYLDAEAIAYLMARLSGRIPLPGMRVKPASQPRGRRQISRGLR